AAARAPALRRHRPRQGPPEQRRRPARGRRRGRDALRCRRRGGGLRGRGGGELHSHRRAARPRPRRLLRGGHRGGEPPHPGRRPGGRQALRHEHDGGGGPVRRDQKGARRRDRPRRGLAGLPLQGRGTQTRDRGPLLGGRARAQRRPHAGAGLRAPAEEPHNPRSWHGGRGYGGQDRPAGRGRGPLRPLLRRPDGHGEGGGGWGDPDPPPRGPRGRRPGPALRRAGGWRQRQHHRRRRRREGTPGGGAAGRKRGCGGRGPLRRHGRDAEPRGAARHAAGEDGRGPGPVGRGAAAADENPEASQAAFREGGEVPERAREGSGRCARPPRGARARLPVGFEPVLLRLRGGRGRRLQGASLRAVGGRAQPGVAEAGAYGVRDQGALRAAHRDPQALHPRGSREGPRGHGRV
ncbi:MAG: Protein serine/threonine phosphatase PrpC, regulation of stationary phase, partial [uncultured Rubrobacteraceae bacterium]